MAFIPKQIQNGPIPNVSFSNWEKNERIAFFFIHLVPLITNRCSGGSFISKLCLNPWNKRIIWIKYVLKSIFLNRFGLVWREQIGSTSYQFKLNRESVGVWWTPGMNQVWLDKLKKINIITKMENHLKFLKKLNSKPPFSSRHSPCNLDLLRGQLRPSPATHSLLHRKSNDKNGGHDTRIYNALIQFISK